MSYLDNITWNSDGLVPAIAQDAATGRVLMVAWMNAEALQLSVDEQRAVYGRDHGKSSGAKAKSPAMYNRLKNCVSTATAM